MIGIGCHLDSIRFAREIARDLGIHRNRVKALVLGEHGSGLVPLWSTVTVDEKPIADQAEFSDILEKAVPVAQFADTLAEEVKTVVQFMANKGQEGIRQAMTHISKLSPDLRTALTPVGTQFSGAKTPVGTAASVLTLIRTLLSEESITIPVQYLCQGENRFQCPIGVRVVITDQVDDVISNDDLTKEEQVRLAEVCQIIAQNIEKWTQPSSDGE